MSDAIPEWLTGVLPVLPTPFTPEDEVDYPSIARLIDFAKRCGVRTVVTPAFGSEFYKLDGNERQRVIETAVAEAQPRDLRVVVQCNHTTPRLAARLAGEAKNLGASAVSTALPRAFAASESQLLDYARRVCDATELPVIVQDWNPGGRTADAEFFIALHQRCANFRLAKLEEPGVGGTVRKIASETSGRVGVLSGWGGSYAMQLHGAGICGLMPGLALADVFVRLWSHLNGGNSPSEKGARLCQRPAAAHEYLQNSTDNCDPLRLVEDDTAALRDFQASSNMELASREFSAIAPYVQFSLQTFEQFHHAEKHVLWKRGALATPFVRPVTVELDAEQRRYLDLLTQGLLNFIKQDSGGEEFTAPATTKN